MHPLRNRDPALDITRCFALLLVLTNHFMLYNGYTSYQLIGMRMYVLTVLQNISYLGVCLFLMLSGYLMHNKRPTKSYFSKIWKTVWIYILASVLTYVYMRLNHAGSVEYGTLTELVLMILSFEAAPYSWYIEMYLGLFFLIPYLNLFYHGLQTKKEKQVLLLVFTCLTCLPRVVNSFTYSMTEGFQYVVHSDSHFRFMPGWWNNLYPITFYLCGVYLQEYPLKKNGLTRFLMAVASILLISTIDFALNYNDSYLLTTWQDNGSIFHLFSAFFVFNYLTQINCQNMPQLGRSILAKLSDVSLGAYLISWIFDNLFYPVMLALEPNPAYNLKYYPLMMAAVFLCSCAASAVIHGIYDLVSRYFHKDPVLRQ